MLDDIRFERVFAERHLLRQWLTQVASTASELAVAVGYLSPDGLADLLTSIDATLPRIERIRVIAGNLEAATNPEKVVGIRKKLADLGDRLTIRHYAPSTGIFHPKIYLARSANGWHASAGSSNLTSGGLHKNVEFDVVTRAPEGNVYAKKFDEWWQEAKPVRAEDWPLQPQFEAMLHQAMQKGSLVRVKEYLEKASAPIRVSDHSPEPFHGDLLKLAHSWEGQAYIVRKDKLDEVRNAAKRIRRNLRTISLKTPWNDARFVPEALQQELEKLLEREERALESLVCVARESVEDPETFLHNVEAQVDKALESLAEQRRDEIKKQILKTAEKRHSDFVQGCPRPLDIRIEFSRVPELGSYTLASMSQHHRRTEETAQREWRDWLITVATAPRRSLKKYRNVDRARALSLLPDTQLDSIIRSKAEPLFAQGSPPPDQQLDDQIKKVSFWRSQDRNALMKNLADFYGVGE